jgi:hypothetical protein
VSYRRPTKQLGGAWARHIDNWLREHDWSVNHAFEQWHDELGLGERSRASWVKVVSGERPPNERQAKFLVSVMGEPEAGTEQAISEGGGDAATLLAAFRDALLEQTRALAEVRLELREARRTAEEERGVIAEILARLEARLELGTEPASNGAGDAGPALRHA